MSVVIEIPDPVAVYADPEQLGRVLTNLLINAAQAMNGKGRIWVDGAREGTVTHIRVRDDGPGVPSHLRERVFEALFTTKAKGSGLGLALCRRIVEAHGGTIKLEPADRGAAFRISIPDSKDQAPQAVDDAPS